MSLALLLLKLSLLCVHVEMFSEVETPSEFPPKIEKKKTHEIKSMQSVSFSLEDRSNAYEITC